MESSGRSTSVRRLTSTLFEMDCVCSHEIRFALITPRPTRPGFYRIEVYHAASFVDSYSMDVADADNIVAGQLMQRLYLFLSSRHLPCKVAWQEAFNVQRELVQSS